MRPTAWSPVPTSRSSASGTHCSRSSSTRSSATSGRSHRTWSTRSSARPWPSSGGSSSITWSMTTASSGRPTSSRVSIRTGKYALITFDDGYYNNIAGPADPRGVRRPGRFLRLDRQRPSEQVLLVGRALPRAGRPGGVGAQGLSRGDRAEVQDDRADRVGADRPVRPRRVRPRGPTSTARSRPDELRDFARAHTSTWATTPPTTPS